MGAGDKIRKTVAIKGGISVWFADPASVSDRKAGTSGFKETKKILVLSAIVESSLLSKSSMSSTALLQQTEPFDLSCSSCIFPDKPMGCKQHCFYSLGQLLPNLNLYLIPSGQKMKCLVGKFCFCLKNI